MSDTATWLEELGAVRPMAPAGSEVLVLGPWHAGYYAIHWTRYRDRNGTVQELWDVFGLRVDCELTRDDCRRILSALKAAKGADDGER